MVSQTKLSKKENKAQEPEFSPDFNARYGNGQRLRDAFEVIENSGVENTVMLNLSEDRGLQVKTANAEKSIASVLSAPPASFEVLEGKGVAVVSLEDLMKALQRARRKDSIRISTTGQELSLEYPESNRRLAVPLAATESDETVQLPALRWDGTLEADCKELRKTLKDLSELEGNRVRVSIRPNSVTFSQTIDGVGYQKEFAKDGAGVESFEFSSTKSSASSEYSLDKLRSVLSRRFEKAKLNLGDGLPAKITYSLDDTGGSLTVFLAPSS